jgi:hypothetical protein
MGAWIEVIVVDRFWLIQEHSLPISVDWSHHGFILGRQVIVEERLVFGIKNVLAHPSGLHTLTLYLENDHPIVVSSCKIVELRVGSQDPIAISVLASLVYLDTPRKVP